MPLRFIHNSGAIFATESSDIEIPSEADQKALEWKVNSIRLTMCDSFDKNIRKNEPQKTNYSCTIAAHSQWNHYLHIYGKRYTRWIRLQIIGPRMDLKAT